jgi:Uma2 family endonuclease
VVNENSTPCQGKKKLTYRDYAGLPEEPGYRLEIIDGVLMRDPSPGFHHQRVSRRLQRALEDYFIGIDPKGEVFCAPLDLSLCEYNVVQPDLFYLPGNRPARQMPIGALPELVAEITSPFTSRKDRVKKLNHYQAVGVLHCWILDPEDAFIEAYELRDGRYVSIVRAHEGAFDHPGFPGLSFDIEKLFTKPD